MTKGTTFIRRRGPRPPDPYVTDRGDGTFDVACRSCRVRVAGLRSRAAAEGWAGNHRCTTEIGRPQRRPRP